MLCIHDFSCRISNDACSITKTPETPRWHCVLVVRSIILSSPKELCALLDRRVMTRLTSQRVKLSYITDCRKSRVVCSFIYLNLSNATRRNKCQRPALTLHSHRLDYMNKLLALGVAFSSHHHYCFVLSRASSVAHNPRSNTHRLAALPTELRHDNFASLQIGIVHHHLDMTRKLSYSGGNRCMQ